MHQPLKTTARETRAILADVSIAQMHPSTAERPEPGSPRSRHLMHALHVGLMKAGKLANRNHTRKEPQWPLNTESVDVLGYGAEKVVYKVKSGDDMSDRVVSVYHMESVLKDPAAVIERKRDRYRTYKDYFGDQVLPTSFIIIDNPWGDGAKPASIQPFIEDAHRLSDMSESEVRDLAESDPKFGRNLDHLVKGYRMMMSDGLRPDFASSNLLISGSDLVIFDTGMIYEAEKDNAFIRASSNYQLLDALGAEK